MHDQPAARGADEPRLADVQRIQPGQHVVGLDPDIVVAGVRVPVRAAAPAIVEGYDPAPRRRASRKVKRQFVEVACVAGQAGQAHHRPAVLLRLAIDARMQA